MRPGSASALAALALMAFAQGPRVHPAPGATEQSVNRQMPARPNATMPGGLLEAFRFLGNAIPGRRGGYPRRSGWTNARYQRAARKRRNQQLNRRAHRG